MTSRSLEVKRNYGDKSYDEVLRFRTSVAKYTGNQPYTFRGLKKNGGTLASWVDKYDLNVFTPNSCRGTHALVIEVTQQPPEYDDENEEEDNMSSNFPLIPRIRKADIKNTKLGELSPISIQHYQGPKNPIPLSSMTMMGSHIIQQSNLMYNG